MDNVQSPRLHYTAVEVYDQKGQPVASIAFPIFVSGPVK
jgi:hypothetical protein